MLMSRIIDKQREFNENNKYPFYISMSVGAAYFNPENPISINELMAKADKLMYENKKSRQKDEIAFVKIIKVNMNFQNSSILL